MAYDDCPVLRAGENADQFCQQFLQQTGVLLLPVSQFLLETDEGFEACVRFGFGRRNMSECLSKMGPFLSTYYIHLYKRPMAHRQSATKQ